MTTECDKSDNILRKISYYNKLIFTVRSYSDD